MLIIFHFQGNFQKRRVVCCFSLFFFRLKNTKHRSNKNYHYSFTCCVYLSCYPKLLKCPTLLRRTSIVYKVLWAQRVILMFNVFVSFSNSLGHEYTPKSDKSHGVIVLQVWWCAIKIACENVVYTRVVHLSTFFRSVNGRDSIIKTTSRQLFHTSYLPFISLKWLPDNFFVHCIFSLCHWNDFQTAFPLCRIFRLYH